MIKWYIDKNLSLISKTIKMMSNIATSLSIWIQVYRMKLCSPLKRKKNTNSLMSDFLLSPKDLVILHIPCPVRGIITKSDFTYCKMWLLALLWASHHHTTIHKRASRCLVHVGGVSNVPTRIINGTVIVHPFNPSEIQGLSASTNKPSTR